MAFTTTPRQMPHPASSPQSAQNTTSASEAEAEAEAAVISAPERRPLAPFAIEPVRTRPPPPLTRRRACLPETPAQPHPPPQNSSHRALSLTPHPSAPHASKSILHNPSSGPRPSFRLHPSARVRLPKRDGIPRPNIALACSSPSRRGRSSPVAECDSPAKSRRATSRYMPRRYGAWTGARATTKEMRYTAARGLYKRPRSRTNYDSLASYAYLAAVSPSTTAKRTGGGQEDGTGGREEKNGGKDLFNRQP